VDPDNFGSRYINLVQVDRRTDNLAWWRNGYDVGLVIEKSPPGRVTIIWLLIGWVTIRGHVNRLGI